MRRLIRYGGFFAIIAAALLVAAPILMRFAVRPYIHESISHIRHSDVALVLGASIYQGKPSPVLERRAAKAVELYKAGHVDHILVTGDNGEEAVDEVTPVRKYLLEMGIPAEDIFLDHAGFDTYSSMYRARDVFGAQSVIVVTQDFHMPRALFIARELGIDAYGVLAEGDGAEKDYVREVPASVKAVFDIVTGRMPQYLGERIPLEGDGSATWY